MRPITGILKKDLKNLYIRKGMTTYQIANHYKCCQGTIWKLLHKYDISLRAPGNPVYIPRPELKELYINKKLSSRKIAKKYHCAYSTVDNKIKKYNFERRNLAQAHIIYPRRNFDGKPCDKAYLIGFSMGDLRVRKLYKNSETISIDCGSTQQEQIKLIKDLFKPYGRVSVSRLNSRGKRQIQANLNMSFNFLLNLNGKIDSWIMDDKDYFAAFLAGFTDAEGSFYISKGRAAYSLGNYNRTILFQIHKLLSNMGIFCPKPYSDNNRGYKDKQGYVRKQDYWKLSIHKKLTLICFFQLLKPFLRHDKKKADMERAWHNVLERNRKFNNFRILKQ